MEQEQNKPTGLALTFRGSKATESSESKFNGWDLVFNIDLVKNLPVKVVVTGSKNKATLTATWNIEGLTTLSFNGISLELDTIEAIDKTINSLIWEASHQNTPD